MMLIAELESVGVIFATLGTTIATAGVLSKPSKACDAILKHQQGPCCLVLDQSRDDCIAEYGQVATC